MSKKKEVVYICLCLQCGRSSNAGNECAFEETKRMSHCPTYFHISKLKPKRVKK